MKNGRPGRLNPIPYRKLKAAFRHEMEKNSDFSPEEISLFLEMMDRIGRDEITKFLLVSSKLSNIEISDTSWQFAEDAIEEHEAEKKIRRGR